MTTRNLSNLKECKTGLEVHLMEVEGRDASRKARALLNLPKLCEVTKVQL